ncbi:uncharacterized protein LOC106083830 [Stomoxys calcitrans]|uniref:uncharacterized protein LOC106083830 n=1 Tax=Stomoxys calcitrans TaxID=35570 RepID=UPI0027E2CF56|nr:uncharacterized protein LOC106083830 [Stomoxys calcitrans]
MESLRDNTNPLLDLERLQKLSYERSKLWSAFLDNIHESENLCEIPLNDVEKCLETISNDYNDDDDDELASMEDENYVDNIDPEVLRDITNSTRLSLMFNSTKKLEDVSTNKASHDIIDMLNETLPVINEHNRQMKESGMDRILSTFDSKKIEKVGGWLKRHNSLCAADIPKTASSERRDTARMRKNNLIEHLHREPAYRNCIPEEDTESDDSFDSGETARYIRSSRIGSVKNSASTTMMIKTYRMFKSTRQALRDKYACVQDEDADLHLNELRLRRRLAKESAMLFYKDKHFSSKAYEPLYPYFTPTHSQHFQRRKLFRKRTASNSCSTMDESSTDSDDLYQDEGERNYHRRHHQACCNQRHCSGFVTGHHLTTSSKRSQYCLSEKMSVPSHDHMYSYLKAHARAIPSTSGKKKPLKRLDNRPCKRESECKCCNEKRLCKEYKHLADTSTEEWIVENCFSPTKKPMMTSTQLEIVNDDGPKQTIDVAGQKQAIHNPVDWGYESVKKDRSKKTETEEIKADEYGKNIPKSNVTKKVRKYTKKKDVVQKASAEDSFERELELALKLSEAEFKKQQKNKTAENEMQMKKEDDSLPKVTTEKNCSTSRKKVKNLDDNNNTKDKRTMVKIGKKKTEILPSKAKRKNHSKGLKGKLEQEHIDNENFLTLPTTRMDQMCETENIVDNYELEELENAKEKSVVKENKNYSIDLLESSNSKNNSTICKSKLGQHNTNEEIDFQQEKLSKRISHINKSTTLSHTKSRISECEGSTEDRESQERTVESKLEHCIEAPNKGTKKVKRKELAEKKAGKEHFVPMKEYEADRSIHRGNVDRNFENNCDAVEIKGRTFGKKINMSLSKNLKPVDKTSIKDTRAYQITQENTFSKAKENNEDNHLWHQDNEEHENGPSYSTTSSIALSKKKKKEQNDSLNLINVTKQTVKEKKTSSKRQSFKTSEKKLYTLSSDDEFEENKTEKSKDFSSNNKKDSYSETKQKFGGPKNQTTKRQITENDDVISKRIALYPDQDSSRTIDKEVIADKGDETIKKKPNASSPSDEDNLKNIVSNVSSTTTIPYSPEVNRTRMGITQDRSGRYMVECESKSEALEEINCTVVSSTTNTELLTSSSLCHTNQQDTLNATVQRRRTDKKKGILIYAPKNSSIGPDQQQLTRDDGFFNITLEHLSKVIGQKPAEKFLKYYIGPLRFNSNSTVYLRPPTSGVQDTSVASTSESDDDVLDYANRCGDLYASFGEGRK